MNIVFLLKMLHSLYPLYENKRQIKKKNLKKKKKNLKIQNGRHFWEKENFLKIAKSTFLRYPMGRKFQRNNSILHG